MLIFLLKAIALDADLATRPAFVCPWNWYPQPSTSSMRSSISANFGTEILTRSAAVASRSVHCFPVSGFSVPLGSLCRWATSMKPPLTRLLQCLLRVVGARAGIGTSWEVGSRQLV